MEPVVAVAVAVAVDCAGLDTAAVAAVPRDRSSCLRFADCCCCCCNFRTADVHNASCCFRIVDFHNDSRFQSMVEAEVLQAAGEAIRSGEAEAVEEGWRRRVVVEEEEVQLHREAEEADLLREVVVKSCYCWGSEPRVVLGELLACTLVCHRVLP